MDTTGSEIRIGRAAEKLGVSPQYLRMLEWQGRIPPVRRDFRGRVYTRSDIALLRSLGVGTHPERLRTLEEALGISGE